MFIDRNKVELETLKNEREGKEKSLKRPIAKSSREDQLEMQYAGEQAEFETGFGTSTSASSTQSELGSRNARLDTQGHAHPLLQVAFGFERYKESKREDA